MIKQYKCECIHAVFPFGNGMPICIREINLKRKYPFGMKPCIEKGCEHYKKLNTYRSVEQDTKMKERG